MGVAFAPPAPVSLTRVPTRSCCTRRQPWSMAGKGFGSVPEPESSRPPSDASQKRDDAASRLDSMRQQNAPEYSVWLRVKDASTVQDQDSPDFPWLPVGSMCVPRTSNVAAALYNRDVYADLLAGARKLFPQLKKMTDDEIEVGYLMKGSAEDDEDGKSIVVANPPGEESALSKFGNKLKSMFQK